MGQDFVLVRTFSAGVHCGFLVERDGKEVRLSHARRIWRWSGANSLNEISLYGVSQNYTRISEAVIDLVLTEAIEIIICTDVAKENLQRSRWEL